MEHNRVIALGFFDGVHLGHGALLTRCRQEADRRGCQAAVMSFDLHPDTLLTGKPTPLLNTPSDRQRLMESLYGIDQVLLCHFDKAMMEMHWETFVTDYLQGTLGAVAVICGHDFHFGHKGQGNPQLLQTLCGRLGLACYVIGKVEYDGVTVSSTHIRQLVGKGSIARANGFLGHCHQLSGQVIHGRQLGRQLGTPTANVALPEALLSPAYGVYATRVFVDEHPHLAVTNVGVRPTVNGGDQVTVEPWLLDFNGDLYEKIIRIEFCAFLRPEQRFTSLETLKSAILENAMQTRDYFRQGEMVL